MQVLLVAATLFLLFHESLLLFPPATILLNYARSFSLSELCKLLRLHFSSLVLLMQRALVRVCVCVCVCVYVCVCACNHRGQMQCHAPLPFGAGPPPLAVCAPPPPAVCVPVPPPTSCGIPSVRSSHGPQPASPLPLH
mmetsp:Transcript_27465/g.73914  ORF Transcript_27465/g.73914 Transcript_27465/m.73914 type:complete len:138 (-) Transcript_27465:2124-2537(-)